MRINNPLPSLEILDVTFFCDAEKGLLTWKKRGKGIVEGRPVGSSTTNGYFRVKLKGTEYLLHRIIYKMATGEDPGNFEIDHINIDRKDNRISNLRLATRSQNAHNVGTTKRNKSGIKGVSYAKHKRKWLALIRLNGVTKNLGYYTTKDKAAEIVQAARNDFHKQFSNHG